MAGNKSLPAHQAFSLLADGRAVRLGLFVVVTSRRHALPPDTDRIATFFTVLYPLSNAPGDPEISAQLNLLGNPATSLKRDAYQENEVKTLF